MFFPTRPMAHGPVRLTGLNLRNHHGVCRPGCFLSSWRDAFRFSATFCPVFSRHDPYRYRKTEYRTETDTVGVEKPGNRSPVFFWCRFRFGVSVEPYFLSPMIGERERRSEGGKDGGGERDTETETERVRDGGRGRGRERNFNSGRKLFFLPCMYCDVRLRMKCMLP